MSSGIIEIKWFVAGGWAKILSEPNEPAEHQ